MEAHKPNPLKIFLVQIQKTNIPFLFIRHPQFQILIAVFKQICNFSCIVITYLTSSFSQRKILSLFFFCSSLTASIHPPYRIHRISNHLLSIQNLDTVPWRHINTKILTKNRCCCQFVVQQRVSYRIISILCNSS